MVETPGIVVACPHYGNHLTAPDFPVDAPETTDDVLREGSDESVAKPEPTEITDSGSIFDESAPGLGDPRTAETQVDDVAEASEPAEDEATEDEAGTRDGIQSSEPSVAMAMQSRRRDTVSRTAFLVLLSYASAVTLACIWLFYQLQNAPLHNLERLPDPVESAEGGGGVLTLVAIDSPMPTGHTLLLGQTRKFGHVRVTPLRVSRGELEFEALEQFGGGATRESIGPVLKLHLRFENASGDQKIAPLDRTLMLSRRYDNDQVLANNFVRPGDGSSITLLHDNPIEGNWNWKGQGADGIDGKVLEPGERSETFLPTGAEGIGSLTGPLLWRVHIRKGYSSSGRGVTTVFEVAFHSSQIEDETRRD